MDIDDNLIGCGVVYTIRTEYQPVFGRVAM